MRERGRGRVVGGDALRGVCLWRKYTLSYSAYDDQVRCICMERCSGILGGHKRGAS